MFTGMKFRELLSRLKQDATLNYSFSPLQTTSKSEKLI
jgi:hypothetical protein